MIFNPARHRRRSIRLQGYDYSQIGAYFVTICAHHWVCLFGDIVDGEMRLSDAGRVVEATWEGLPSQYPGVALDVFVIMPNHFHGIMVIDCIPNRSSVGAQFIAPSPPRIASPADEDAINRAPTTGALIDEGAINRAPTTDMLNRSPSLGEIVRGFKARTTRILHRDLGILHVWQRNYYEHVIRDDASLSRIREYITNNPVHWAFDRENPVHHVAADQ
jgi:REP element-mobilizing transposase RayT